MVHGLRSRFHRSKAVFQYYCLEDAVFRDIGPYSEIPDRNPRRLWSVAFAGSRLPVSTLCVVLGRTTVCTIQPPIPAPSYCLHQRATVCTVEAPFARPRHHLHHLHVPATVCTAEPPIARPSHQLHGPGTNYTAEPPNAQSTHQLHGLATKRPTGATSCTAEPPMARPSHQLHGRATKRTAEQCHCRTIDVNRQPHPTHTQPTESLARQIN